jgi:protein involved in polysaccharide export with SLBB domain
MKKLSVLLLLLAAVAAGAQKESILIGTGDQINIDVFDTPELMRRKPSSTHSSVQGS